GWIGKDFSGAPVKLHYVVVTGSSDFGFDGSSDTTTVTINIRGKNGGVPSSRTDGDLLGSWTGSDAPGLSRLIATGDNSTVPYDYLFVEIISASTPNVNVAVAELDFYEGTPSDLFAEGSHSAENHYAQFA